METIIVYWGCIGIVEKIMETTIVHLYRESGNELLQTSAEAH